MGIWVGLYLDKYGIKEKVIFNKDIILSWSYRFNMKTYIILALLVATALAAPSRVVREDDHAEEEHHRVARNDHTDKDMEFEEEVHAEEHHSRGWDYFPKIVFQNL
jgi:hypothetical protein